MEELDIANVHVLEIDSTEIVDTNDKSKNRPHGLVTVLNQNDWEQKLDSTVWYSNVDNIDDSNNQQ